MDHKHQIVGIHITNRVKTALDVQAILSEYGCNIKTRLGLHDVDDKICSPHGLVVLELCGEKNQRDDMLKKLKAINGLEVKEMNFSY